jgi:uncharacterized protein YbjT (DUF2867 family)
MMEIAIAGGHGKIGRRLIRMLNARGDKVRSLDRNPNHASDIREAASMEEVAQHIDCVDAVVFAAGAGPGSGSERKLTMDYGGAVKLIAAAKAKGIRRYVMISSIGADSSANGDDTFRVYLRAKGQADAELQSSGLDYTIVRPTSLTNDPGTGRVEIGKRLEATSISRDDVAAVLAAVLHVPTTIGKTFEVTAGNVPVEQAIASL